MEWGLGIGGVSIENRICAGAGAIVSGVELHKSAAATPAPIARPAARPAKSFRFDPVCAAGGASCALGEIKASWRSRPASPMSCRRSFGSFSRHRRSSLRIAGGVLSGSSDQSGSPSGTAASVSVTVAAANATRPVSISYTTQPNAQMSARRSTGFPRACSGLIYAGVPTTMPSCDSRSLKRRFGPLDRFRQPEVEHLHGAFRRDLNVGRLQIAVNDGRAREPSRALRQSA